MTEERGQLALPLGFGREGLRLAFERALGRPVDLTLTDNSSSLFTARRKNGVVAVRIHRMFADAEEEVVKELVAYARGARKTTPRFRHYVRQNGHRIRERPPRRITLRPRGRHYNLSAFFDEVNSAYFGGAVRAGVTWGSKPRNGRVARRILGSWSPRTGVIRLSPLLDRRWVPRYYVRFVLYHEMLHAHLGGMGHTAEFRRLERRFKEFERAEAYERRRAWSA